MMRKLLVVLLLTFATTINAQLQTPNANPLSKIQQKVGLTNITIEYSRPSMKGRKIYGDLVPFNKLWRTGANANTIITFSDDVVVGGKALKSGAYALYTKPGKSSWEFIFYGTTDNIGLPKKWNDSDVAISVKAKPKSLPIKAETFTIALNDLTYESAVLGLMWANTFVGVDVEVPTSQKAITSIEKTLQGKNASAKDYFESASFYYQSNKDIKNAMKWIEKANKMTKDAPKFEYQNLQALIFAKAGRTKKAVKMAKASLHNAQKARNEEYVNLNKAFLKKFE